jgi:hypothetical protein
VQWTSAGYVESNSRSSYGATTAAGTPGSCRLKDPLRFWPYREIPVGAEMCPGSGRCGMIFCKECTEAKRVLPHIHATQLQRVCDACVVQLNTL